MTERLRQLDHVGRRRRACRLRRRVAHRCRDSARLLLSEGADQPARTARCAPPGTHDGRVHRLRCHCAPFRPILDDFLATHKALTCSLSLAGVATLGVAAVPLSRSGGGFEDVAHGALATLGYIGMAVSPMIGAVAFFRRRQIAAAGASALAGVVSAAALAATPFVSADTGLLQRLGLGVVDAWIVAMAISILAGGRATRAVTAPVPAN